MVKPFSQTISPLEPLKKYPMTLIFSLEPFKTISKTSYSLKIVSLEALKIFSKPLISLEPPSVLLSVTDLKGEGSGSACTERSCNELNGCDDDDNFLESHCIGGDYIQNRSP